MQSNRADSSIPRVIRLRILQRFQGDRKQKWSTENGAVNRQKAEWVATDQERQCRGEW
jgi:hypothetical protein